MNQILISEQYHPDFAVSNLLKIKHLKELKAKQLLEQKESTPEKSKHGDSARGSSEDKSSEGSRSFRPNITTLPLMRNAKSSARE